MDTTFGLLGVAHYSGNYLGNYLGTTRVGELPGWLLGGLLGNHLGWGIHSGWTCHSGGATTWVDALLGEPLGEPLGLWVFLSAPVSFYMLLSAQPKYGEP